jgi:hypothetical protein
VSKLILACDPGITGAWALLSEAGQFVAVGDMPIIRDNKLGWVDALALYATLRKRVEGHEAIAIVERVHAMPKNGTVAAFSQGATLCSLLATLQIVGARIELITPGTWKRQLGFTFTKDDGDRVRKEASLNKARLLFPTAALDRQKDHGRAEALLIGHWYLQHRTMARAA